MTKKSKIFTPNPTARCCGKNSYVTRQDAEHVAEEQMLIDTSLSLAVYACICGCRGWHLTRGAGDPNEE